MLQNKNKQWHKWMIFIALASILALAAGCGSKKTGEAASYTGGTISTAELDSFLGANKFFNYNPYYDLMSGDPSFKEQMLKQMIGFKAIAGKADEKVKEKAEGDAKKQIDQLNESVKENKEMKQQLDQFYKDNKISAKDLQSYLVLRFTVGDYLNSQVTDEMVKAEYDRTIKEDKLYYDTAKVSHILIGLKDQEGNELRTEEEASKRANEVLAKVKAGGDFAELAKEYSDDPGTKEQGGALEIQLSEGAPWAPEFKQAVIDMKEKGLSEPVLTDFGYHIIRVDEKKAKTYEDVKDQVKNIVIGDQFNEFMDKEYPKLNVKITLPKDKGQDQNDSEQAPDADGSPDADTTDTKTE